MNPPDVLVLPARPQLRLTGVQHVEDGCFIVLGMPVDGRPDEAGEVLARLQLSYGGRGKLQRLATPREANVGVDGEA